MNILQVLGVSLGIVTLCGYSRPARGEGEPVKKIKCKAEKPTVLQSGAEPAELGYYGDGFVTATVVPGSGIRLQLLDLKGKITSSRLVGGPYSSHPVLSGVGGGQTVAWLDGKVAGWPDEVWMTTLSSDGTENKPPRKIYTFTEEERPPAGAAWLVGSVFRPEGAIAWADQKGNFRSMPIKLSGPAHKSSVIATSTTPRSRPIVAISNGTTDVSWLALGEGGKSDLMDAEVRFDGSIRASKLKDRLDTAVDPNKVPGFGQWVVVTKGHDVLGASALSFHRDFDVVPPPPGGTPTQWAYLEGAVAAFNRGGLWVGYSTVEFGEDAEGDVKMLGYVSVKGTKGKTVSGLRITWNSPNGMMATWHEGSGAGATNRAVAYVCP